MDREENGWGLRGLGVAGDVTIELLEPIGHKDWRLQVDIGLFDFDCESTSPEVLGRLSEFFAETFRTGRFLDEEVSPGRFRHMPRKQLVLGTIGGLDLVIVKDGEHDDRYFIVLKGSGACLRFTPTLEQTERLIAAVEQAREDAGNCP